RARGPGCPRTRPFRRRPCPARRAPRSPPRAEPGSAAALWSSGDLRPPEEKPLDQRDREDESEQDHSDRGRIPELDVEDRLVVEVENDRHCRVVRSAGRAADEERLVEHLQSPDDRDDRNEEVPRLEQRKGDLPEG